MYFLGTSNEAKNYDYEIELSCEENEEKLFYSGQVVSLDVPKEEVIRSDGNRLCLTDLTVQLFRSKGKLNYEVVILESTKLCKIEI